MAIGDLDASFLRYPWGAIIAVNYLYLLVVIRVQSDKWRWLNRLSDRYACTSSLASMVVMTVIFGLTRQDASAGGVAGALGFSRMTSSWTFNLLLLYFTTAVGLAVTDDLLHIRRRRSAAVMSHLGVFILLAVGIFGSGDMQRVTVTTVLDRPVNAGRDRANAETELPFAITLREFRMDEYPPKLYLLDTGSETSSQDFISVESDGADGEIDGWRIRAGRYLDMAGRMPDEDEYRAMKHVGAAPAVYVTAENSGSGEIYEGWVSCGSHIFEPSYLRLGDRYAVAMPRREAKRYLSRVTVTDADGRVGEHDIEVNHPARVGSWRIYQVGYDTSRGRWSTVSVLECVRDPWYGAAHVALWLMLAAGVVMFVTAGGRRAGVAVRSRAEKSGKEVRS